MKIGGENRLEWVMARHWEWLAKEVNINLSVFKKQLLNFCEALPDRIQGTHLKFIEKYGHNQLVEAIVSVVQKRNVRTLKHLK